MGRVWVEDGARVNIDGEIDRWIDGWIGCIQMVLLWTMTRR